MNVRGASVAVGVMAVVSALPSVGAAQDRPPDDWPTAVELRRELQGIGYVFGLRGGTMWRGGRPEAAQSSTYDESTVIIFDGDFDPSDGDERANVHFGVGPDDWRLTWPESSWSAYTALAEVLDILGVDLLERRAVLEHLTGEIEVGCRVLALRDGGMVVITGLETEWSVGLFPEHEPEQWCDDFRELSIGSDQTG